MEIGHHFIRKKIDSKELVLSFVNIQDQVAVFFRYSSIGGFDKNVDKLNIFDMYTQLERKYYVIILQSV